MPVSSVCIVVFEHKFVYWVAYYNILRFNPPAIKNTTLLFLAKLPLNCQTVQAPLFGSPPSILVFRETLPKK